MNGKATDFKFGRHAQRVHSNRSPLKILEKMEHGRIQRLPDFGDTTNYQIGTKFKSNFVRTFIGSIGIKTR